MEMYNPVHPGKVLKELYMEPLHLSISEVAKGLRITREALSALINGRSGISTEMAIRLANAFETTPVVWLNMQNQYDLWKAKKKTELAKVKVFISTSSAALDEAEMIKT